MPTEMTERLERALAALAASYDSWVVYPDLVTETIAAYREARDAAEPITNTVEIGDWPDKQGRYPQSGVGVPAGYVLRQFPDGLFWVPSDPKWEAPLTVERLVRVLREQAEALSWGGLLELADALEKDEEE